MIKKSYWCYISLQGGGPGGGGGDMGGENTMFHCYYNKGLSFRICSGWLLWLALPEGCGLQCNNTNQGNPDKICSL